MSLMRAPAFTSKLIRTFTSSSPKPYVVPSNKWGQNRAARLELAAAYRILNHLGLNEGVCNHLSAMAPRADGNGEVMLIFPFGIHWSEVNASNLLGLDEDANTVEGVGAPEPSASCIHLGIRKVQKEARVILHIHSPHSTALACLMDPTMKMIHQNSCRFFNRIAYDTRYAGLAHAMEEGQRMGKVLGNNAIMVMGNHGVLAVGSTVAMAYENVYYFERAAQVQVLAESTHQPLSVMAENEAQVVNSQLLKYEEKYADAHFYSMYRKMRRIQPEFEL